MASGGLGGCLSAPFSGRHSLYAIEPQSIQTFGVALLETLNHTLGEKSVDLVCPGARLQGDFDHGMSMEIIRLLPPGGQEADDTKIWILLMCFEDELICGLRFD